MGLGYVDDLGQLGCRNYLIGDKNVGPSLTDLPVVILFVESFGEWEVGNFVGFGFLLRLG